MKKYILTLSKTFPKSHKRSGELTGFESALLNALNDADSTGQRKLHTIRANYELWEHRFAEINSGKAVLSIREWTGSPYRSKQREIIALGKDDGIGLQALYLTDLMRPGKIEGNEIRLPLIAMFDGLSFNDWFYWFSRYDISKPLAVIHFTKFRY
ncbi:MAG: hypothetical protein K2M69_05790 [Muribaculaceae bacterium]|nr:hypothetical protein [Muribaculaceae bacterium]